MLLGETVYHLNTQFYNFLSKRLKPRFFSSATIADRGGENGTPNVPLAPIPSSHEASSESLGGRSDPLALKPSHALGEIHNKKAK